MKIRLDIGETSVTATLDDSAASRDLASLLPLALKMDDLLSREKSGQLPRPLAEEGERTFRYQVGDVVYWPPARHLAVFYRQDGRSLPQPGMIRLGAVDGGLDALAGSSPVRAVIERID